MCEPVSNEELDRLLEPVPEGGKAVGWPVVIDYQTFCSRMANYGVSVEDVIKAKAALMDAELAYRFFGKKQSVSEYHGSLQ